jgi:FkbM family methyltransferase
MLGEKGFADQHPVEFPVANYPLSLPSNHPLTWLLDPHSPRGQPYREAGLIYTVQALEALGRTGTAIDIGANVGDTCAIIHRLSRLSILCIEASDFFFPYLQTNIRRHFAARAVAHQRFVVARPEDLPTGLYHEHGTARPVADPPTESCGALVMAELLEMADPVALLKIDVDGLDLELVDAALAHRQPRFPIYFEIEMHGATLDKVRAYGAQAQLLFARAAAAGYDMAWLWDDRGRFYGRIDTADSAALANALNYMGHFQQRPVWGFDVCLVHRDDGALAAELARRLSVNAVVPLR